MGQLTEDFIRRMEVNSQREIHTPTTCWEQLQLARAWLELQAMRNLLNHVKGELRNAGYDAKDEADIIDGLHDLVGAAGLRDAGKQ